MKTLHKTLLTLLFASVATLSLNVAAEETKTAPEQCPQMRGMMGEMNPENMKAMQEHMLAMHDLFNKILAEKDPVKKQALKDQQLELMKAHVAHKMAKHQEMMKAHEGAEKK